MSKKDEWGQITKFICDNEFPDQFEWQESRPLTTENGFSDWLLWNQLNAVWTAFCIHHNLEPDTKDYDRYVMSIWNQIGCLGDFGNFDLFMGQYLC